MATKFSPMPVPEQLSSAWLFFLLATLFRDIHNFVRPGFIDQALSGVVNGFTVTDELLLIGGLVVTLPIGLIWLSRMLPKRINQWANGLVALMNIGFVVTTPHSAVDEIYFAVLHMLALLFILWSAVRWQTVPQTS
ncbi:DUF6326 family protein [uncultured Tateyamaria sp.]|uniref:DUF6326 family protein n=1 Tax=uncultured Tateyamaria sp. TaxID=455651 RepID=UPI0026117988|nr:DUF6326 family protein [uncultured Tateyamaria sp.]